MENQNPTTTPTAPVVGAVPTVPAPTAAPVKVVATPTVPVVGAAPVVAPKPAVVAAAPTAQKPTATAPVVAAAPVPAVPKTAVTSAPVPTAKAQNQAPSSKKFLLGCLGAFGCSLFLFIAVIFGFLAFGSTNSPIFSFLGVAPDQVYNVIFTLTNLIFLVLVFLMFIFVVVGFFKRLSARKDDLPAKRKSNIFIFVSFMLLTFFIVSWIMAYFYLVDKRAAPVKRDPIVTTPVNTINITAPVTIKFDGSKAVAGRTDIQVLSYNWDFGDGAKARGDTQTHTYTELGDYKVTLSIIAKNKQTNKEDTIEFTHDVTIDNVLAKVVIKADPSEGPAPLTVSFDATGSSSENGEITDYAWDLDGDGEFDDSTDGETTYTYEQIKTYTAAVRITDSSGQSVESTVEINATESDDPVPVLAIEGVEGTDLTAGTSYVFTAVDSTSPKGKIEKYAWEFSDGTTAATRTVKHTFAENGEYEVTLKVIDSTKRSAEKTVKFTVGEASQAPKAVVTTTPEANAEGVLTGEVPFDVSFNATESTDPNDNIVEYKWDFNADGKVDDTNPEATYSFTKAGSYNAKLTLIDSSDLKTEKTIKVVVTQKGLGVDIKANPISGASPLRVTFDASGSSYPEGNIVSYEWDFGDGSKPRIDTARVTYQYSRIGTFTAKVTAITNDNKRGSSTVSISVRPISLSACFTASMEEGPAPLTVTFDALCSTGTVVRYNWNFGGLKRSNERKPSYTFDKPGDFEVTLEIRDNENVVDTVTKTIHAK